MTVMATQGTRRPPSAPDAQMLAGSASEGRHDEIRERIIVALASVLAVDAVTLGQTLTANGDICMTSPQAEVVIALLEQNLGRGLPGPADLEPEQFASVGALTDLIVQTIQASSGTGTLQASA